MGIEKPDDIEVVHVDPKGEEFGAPNERPTLVLMWHGNGYKRDDCWLQIDEDAACDLASWE
jgi:hypothetical protein